MRCVVSLAIFLILDLLKRPVCSSLWLLWMLRGAWTSLDLAGDTVTVEQDTGADTASLLLLGNINFEN